MRHCVQKEIDQFVLEFVVVAAVFPSVLVETSAFLGDRGDREGMKHP